MLVNEIFYSVQGESTFAGLPCVFVRLTGCNLRCNYCDTRYAYEEGQEMSRQEIVAAVASYGCQLVEITGGEPLLQQETPGLIKELADLNYRVLLETNGSFDIATLDERCIKIVDIKCPSSGEVEQNNLSNLEILTEKDELKFVIADYNDYIFARNLIESLPPERLRQEKILFSAVFSKLAPAQLAEWILADQLKVRMQLQLHKYIWDPEKRGV